ncbi:MAG: ABC transporter substrate-binding protein [Chloroflexi bacterium]|nr:ABC transporter substrate-binding protein [Chloroflexota bacterium]
MVPLRIGHSPDADDAFMFFGFAQGAVRVEPYEIVHIVEDIETLNRRALKGELEVTAASAAVYPQVARHYRVLACGASVGRNYGPIIVARRPLAMGALAGKRVAIPGDHTTAFLLLNIYAPQVVPVPTPFDLIMERVREGEVEAGVLIHEGQITYASLGLHQVGDLGQAWSQETGLPIPLGLDLVHRRLGEQDARRVYDALLASIRYAQEHPEAAHRYAQQFSRGLGLADSRRFVGMYVNQDTLQLGEEGRQALSALYQRAHEKGLIPGVPPLDIVGLA